MRLSRFFISPYRFKWETRHQMKSGWFLFGLWNFGVLLPGWLLVLNGYSQPQMRQNFRCWSMLLMIGGLTLAAIQFLPPFFRRG